MHAPSEHTFNGKFYDLELHIVHKNADATDFSVIGVFFDRVAGGKTSNPFIEEFMKNSAENTSVKGQAKWVSPKLDVKRLVDGLDKQKIFHYDGSLTTPGCSEVVQWIVVNDPQPISEEQLEFFTSKWAGDSSFAKGRGNNRAT